MNYFNLLFYFCQASVQLPYRKRQTARAAVPAMMPALCHPGLSALCPYSFVLTCYEPLLLHHIDDRIDMFFAQLIR